MIENTDKKGLPIGGWLILWGIGLVILTVSSFAGLLTTLLEYLDYEIGEKGLLVTNFYKVWIEYEILYSGIIFISSLVLHYFFWNRRKEFIRIYIIFGIVSFLLTMFEEMLYNIQEFRFYSATLAIFVNNAIWFKYLHKSTRVKQTFLAKKNQYIKISKEEYEHLKNMSQ